MAVPEYISKVANAEIKAYQLIKINGFHAPKITASEKALADLGEIQGKDITGGDLFKAGRKYHMYDFVTRYRLLFVAA